MSQADPSARCPHNFQFRRRHFAGCDGIQRRTRAKRVSLYHVVDAFSDHDIAHRIHHLIQRLQLSIEVRELLTVRCGKT